MLHKNALLVFSKTPQIARDNRDGPFSALPWEDLDALYTACVGDVLRNAAVLTDVDILVYRDRNEISDDFFSPFRQRIRLLDMTGTLLADQVLHGVDDVFSGGYHRALVILDNHPLISTRTLRAAFSQLGYEEDCFVAAPTTVGKCRFVGMNMNNSWIFDSSEGDPLHKPNLLMKKLCSANVMLFVMVGGYSMDSAASLVRLKTDIDNFDRADPEFPSRTYEIFKMFEKKYKLKKPAK